MQLDVEIRVDRASEEVVQAPLRRGETRRVPRDDAALVDLRRHAATRKLGAHRRAGGEQRRQHVDHRAVGDEGGRVGAGWRGHGGARPPGKQRAQHIGRRHDGGAGAWRGLDGGPDRGVTQGVRHVHHADAGAHGGGDRAEAERPLRDDRVRRAQVVGGREIEGGAVDHAPSSRTTCGSTSASARRRSSAKSISVQRRPVTSTQPTW